MNDIKLKWKNNLETALVSIAGLQGINLSRDQVNLIVEKPPKPELGDLAFPLFPLARLFKKNPADIAADVKSFIEENDPENAASVNVTGPYLNIRIDLSRSRGFPDSVWRWRVFCSTGCGRDPSWLD